MGHRRTGKKRVFIFCLLVPLMAAACGSAFADTVTYEYDSLGRLTKVSQSNGSIITYALDPAGNRTVVASGTPPGIPASITVPSSSSTGSYTISWGAASGTSTAGAAGKSAPLRPPASGSRGASRIATPTTS